MTENLFLPKLFCRHLRPNQLVQSILKPEFCQSFLLADNSIALNRICGNVSVLFFKLDLTVVEKITVALSLFPEYTWQSVGVLDYSPEKRQYLVQKVDQNGCVRDSKGKPLMGRAQRNQGKCQREQFQGSKICYFWNLRVGSPIFFILLKANDVELKHKAVMPRRHTSII